MITLLQNTKLQVLLAGAVSTTECPITVEYEEINSRGSSEKTVDGITTGATAVDVLSGTAGARRKVKAIAIHNADSAAVTVTVRYCNPNGTTRTLAKVALQTLETLYFDEERGWYGIDVNGNQKTNATGTSSATSDALSAGTSGGTRASVALSTTVSASTVVSSTESLRTSAGWSVSISKVKSSFSF